MPGVPSLDDALARVGLKAYGSMVGDTEYEGAMQPVSGDRADLLNCYTQIFSTPAGERVLEDLLDKTLRRAVYAPKGQTLEQITIDRVFRDGQSNVVCHILKSIVDARAMNAKPSRGKSKKKSA